MAVTERTMRLPASGQPLTYELERKNVKNMNMRVRPDGKVHLSVPRQTSEAKINAFLTDHEAWLLNALKKTAARAEAHPDTETLAGRDIVPYLGGVLRVVCVPCEGRTGRFELDRQTGTLTLHLPDPQDSGWRMSAVETFEKAQTRMLVMPLLKQHFPYFAQRGVAPPSDVRFRVMTSRFGSCSSGTHALTFNAKLCEYPPAFIEYVVVHELCHFLHPDHSDAFWAEVGRVLPDWREREKIGKK